MLTIIIIVIISGLEQKKAIRAKCIDIDVVHCVAVSGREVNNTRGDGVTLS